MSEVSVSASHSGAACYTGGATGRLLHGLPLSIGDCALTDMPRPGSFPCTCASEQKGSSEKTAGLGGRPRGGGPVTGKVK
jgi:hypothetical protein